jgi:hypothetical protein
VLAAYKRADRDHAQGSYERRVVSANHGSSNVSCASFLSQRGLCSNQFPLFQDVRFAEGNKRLVLFCMILPLWLRS